jgi:hypothetical protein
VHLARSFGIERCRSTFLNPGESHFVFGQWRALNERTPPAGANRPHGRRFELIKPPISSAHIRTNLF